MQLDNVTAAEIKRTPGEDIPWKIEESEPERTGNEKMNCNAPIMAQAVGRRASRQVEVGFVSVSRSACPRSDVLADSGQYSVRLRVP
jgi:hypothetical protein